MSAVIYMVSFNILTTVGILASYSQAWGFRMNDNIYIWVPPFAVAKFLHHFFLSKEKSCLCVCIVRSELKIVFDLLIIAYFMFILLYLLGIHVNVN